MKSFLCARYMHDCVYIYRATDRACSPGRLSGIFGKSGKNYRLRTARRTVQTPAGNLDKWRSNDSRPADLLAERARDLRPSPRRDKKSFAIKQLNVARLTCTSISLQTDFFFFILSDSSLHRL